MKRILKAVPCVAPGRSEAWTSILCQSSSRQIAIRATSEKSNFQNAARLDGRIAGTSQMSPMSR